MRQHMGERFSLVGIKAEDRDAKRPIGRMDGFYHVILVFTAVAVLGSEKGH